MRVLVTFVPDYYPHGTGFAQAFFHLHMALLNNNVVDRIVVFTSNADTETPNDKIEVVYHSEKGVRGLPLPVVKYYSSLILNKQLSHVFAHIEKLQKNEAIVMVLLESMFKGWLIEPLKKRFPQIPVICRIHGTGPEYTQYYKTRNTTKYNEWLLKKVFDNKYVAVTTKFYCDFFQQYFNQYEKFMDRDIFLLPNTTEKETAQFNTDKDVIRLFQLGRLDKMGYHQKGFQDTIKALHLIEQLHPDVASRIMYYTVGKGDREQVFLNSCSSFSRIKHHHFSSLSNQEVNKLEAESDVILLPSRCEGMSMFALEAIASGKPIIFTSGNGLDSLGKNDYNGIAFSCYDYESFADAIIRIASDANLRKIMGYNSRQLFDDNYSYQVVAKKFQVMLKYLRS